ncbi:hypothetical protein V2J09_022577 [Rumex salicifolius]
MSRRAFILLVRRFSVLPLPPSPPSRIPLPPSSVPLITRFFSSNANFPSQDLIRPETKPTAVLSPEDGASRGADGISTEELKKMIGKYMEGDMEILPSIFEAILERKLSGKHNVTDDELMEELRSKTPLTSEHEEEEDDDDFTSDDDFDTDDEDSGSDSDF